MVQKSMRTYKIFEIEYHNRKYEVYKEIRYDDDVIKRIIIDDIKILIIYTTIYYYQRRRIHFNVIL